MTAEQAIHAFWSSFGLAAYDENSVPDEAMLPYLTYSLSYDSFGNQVSMVTNLWYRSTSWVSITAKAKEIFDYISDGGVNLQTDTGIIHIMRGQPFYNRMGDVENNIKRILLNVSAEYICDFD